ncbi:phosphatase PAP2 family protein [Dokdonella ginsengisoli]|uniref:undecaprenyl-diphosphate phosphatase n=1 Tax=Dokdonella ginsengisoli TaxID=363846 RepID=A0ABV9QXE3_9GAMM
MTTWQRLEIGSGERRLCLAMNRWGARRALTRFFRVISRLGDGVFWYALMALLAAFGGTRGLHAAIHMAAVGVIAATLYRVLKRWTRRPRPFRSHADITPYVAPLDEFSFPSGHTLHAVSFTLIALAYFPLLAPPLIAFTVLVAMSRVVLGMHYPSDVLAATLIGCALAGSSLWLVPASWLA